MQDKRIVITGGAGFIGSNLSHELAKNNTITIIDNLLTGREQNISDLINRDNVTFIHGSILDLPMLQQAFSGIDYVFHQAAIPSVPRSIEDPLSTNETNITGTLNVLLASRDNNVKKVVAASSSSVYGDTLILPKVEDMVPNPKSPYALTKFVGEHYCNIFHNIYQLPTICLRYFNVYGPRQRPDSQYAAVIPKFISRILDGESPIIFGDGNQTRDFTFINDVIQANILAAESEATGVFNVGTGRNMDLNTLAETMTAIVGKAIQPVHEEPRAGDVKDSLADISKIRTIGYNPQYTLKDGLPETINWFENAR